MELKNITSIFIHQYLNNCLRRDEGLLQAAFCAALTERFAPVAPVEPLFSAFLPKKPQLAIFNIIQMKKPYFSRKQHKIKL